jgi:hypothetical protein
MTDHLSPAARAILDAAWATCWESVDLDRADVEVIVAGALRALAVRINGADHIRLDVLDIADQLEPLHD